MASTNMKRPIQKRSSPTSKSKMISKDTSPDSKCPICLDKFKNVSYVDRCLHRFCFLCICEWSKNKAECPLCKQPFSSIYHSIKADNDFKKYDLRPMENGSFGNLMGQRFRYRTTQTGEWRPAVRRTHTPPDHGVLFEDLSGSAAHGSAQDFRSMLAAPQMARGSGLPLMTLRDQEIVRFRRELYRRGLRVRGVQDGGRTRETSAEFFRRNPACVHRLVPWLKRELTVLYGAHGSLVNIVQHIVMSHITHYDMQDPVLLQELRPFLLSRTEHFLHEFLTFARSPFCMQSYDQHAIYDCPAPAVQDSDRSDSSVVALSEDESYELQIGPEMPWDDETPGPSYSTEPSRTLPVRVSSSDSDETDEETEPSATLAILSRAHKEQHSDSDDDCVIVGYVKPVGERTPELVQLSSDSEDSTVQAEQTCSPSNPQHIRFTSEPNSPTVISQTHRAFSQISNPERSSWHQHCPSQRDKDSRSHHSKSKWKKSSRSKQHKRSSHDRRHHSRSRSKDKRQTRESHTLTYRHTHIHHSIEKHTSSYRYYKKSHISRLMNCDWRSHAHQQSRSRSPVHLQSRSRSSLHQRSRFRSPARLRSRSRSSLRQRSRSRSPARLRSRSRSSTRQRSCSRSSECQWSRSRARQRSRSRSSARLRSLSRSPARLRSRSPACRRSRSLSPARQQSHTRHHAHSHSRSRSRGNLSHHRKRSKSHSRSRSSPSHRRSRHDKPSGKKKSKSLHVEPHGSDDDDDEKSRQKARKKQKSSSAIVEVVHEGRKRHKKKKKKHKKKSKGRKEYKGESSAIVITIDSDSGPDDCGTALTGSPKPSVNAADSSNVPNTLCMPQDPQPLSPNDPLVSSSLSVRSPPAS